MDIHQLAEELVQGLPLDIPSEKHLRAWLTFRAYRALRLSGLEEFRLKRDLVLSVVNAAEELWRMDRRLRNDRDF